MYQPRVEQCLLENYRDEKAGLRSLTLKDVSGAYLVLAIGTILSVLFFLLERYSSGRCRRRESV